MLDAPYDTAKPFPTGPWDRDRRPLPRTCVRTEESCQPCRLAKLLAPVMAKGKETIQITLGLAAATLSDAIASDGPRKDYQKPAASLGHTWGDENR